jgi:hypothetical protein
VKTAGSPTRVRAGILLAATLALGLFFRFSAPVPESLRDATGGSLYVMFWIFGAVLLFPQASSWKIAIVVLIATCAIEFLQLWQPAWLQALRRTLPGRLVLGTTFSWADFPPYVVGTLCGWRLSAAEKCCELK